MLAPVYYISLLYSSASRAMSEIPSFLWRNCYTTHSQNTKNGIKPYTTSKAKSQKEKMHFTLFMLLYNTHVRKMKTKKRINASAATSTINNRPTLKKTVTQNQIHSNLYEATLSSNGVGPLVVRTLSNSYFRLHMKL